MAAGRPAPPRAEEKVSYEMAAGRPAPPRAEEKVSYETAAVRPIPPQAKEKVTYNKVLRWISGLFGCFYLISAIVWFSMFTTFGLGGQLAVAMLVVLIAVVCWLTALVPQWVSAKSRVRLDKGLVFALVLAVLFLIGWIITELGSVPTAG